MTTRQCEKCGTTTEAPCGCGARYVPAAERAKAAIKAAPETSNRAIADEIGVSRESVRQARSQVTSDLPPDAGVLGEDGKRYPVRRERREPEPEMPLLDPPVPVVKRLELLGKIHAGEVSAYIKKHPVQMQVKEWKARYKKDGPAYHKAFRENLIELRDWADCLVKEIEPFVIDDEGPARPHMEEIA